MKKMSSKALNISKTLEKILILFFRFVAEPQHFPEGRLYLSCKAQIEDLWEATVEEVIFGASNITKTHLLVRNFGKIKLFNLVYLGEWARAVL